MSVVFQWKSKRNLDVLLVPQCPADEMEEIAIDEGHKRALNSTKSWLQWTSWLLFGNVLGFHYFLEKGHEADGQDFSPPCDNFFPFQEIWKFCSRKKAQTNGLERYVWEKRILSARILHKLEKNFADQLLHFRITKETEKVKDFKGRFPEVLIQLLSTLRTNSFFNLSLQTAHYRAEKNWENDQLIKEFENAVFFCLKDKMRIVILLGRTTWRLC